MCVDTIFCWPENWFVRLANGARIESGIDHLCHLPDNPPDYLSLLTPFFKISVGKKKSLTFAFWQGSWLWLE
jgi:hypothetical protein